MLCSPAEELIWNFNKMQFGKSATVGLAWTWETFLNECVIGKSILYLKLTNCAVTSYPNLVYFEGWQVIENLTELKQGCYIHENEIKRPLVCISDEPQKEGLGRFCDKVITAGFQGTRKLPPKFGSDRFDGVENGQTDKLKNMTDRQCILYFLICRNAH